MAVEAIEITRYPNRRFYDRSRGQYVTLSEIAEMVRGGQTVVVRDSKTGEDLTRAVLAQIILERHPERMDLFPASLLHLVLQANDLVLDWMRIYLRQSMDFVERMSPLTTVPPLVPPLAAPLATPLATPLTGAFPSPLDWMRAFFPGPSAAAGASVAAGSGAADHTGDEAGSRASRGGSMPPSTAGADPKPRNSAKRGSDESASDVAQGALLQRLAQLERRLSELEGERPK